jgi:probable rRNA maturation factor
MPTSAPVPPRSTDEPPGPPPDDRGVTATLDDERAGRGNADDDVDLSNWAGFVACVLEAEALHGAVVAVRVVDEDVMAALNEEWMGSAGPTDVLSFPLDPEPPADGSPWLLGDIVVCLDVAQRQAPTHAGTLDDELALLLVHGVLHLLGHDHAAADERERMQARERALLAACHGPVAGDPWSERAPA